MKFTRCPYKAVAKGITPRRLAAAKRALLWSERQVSSFKRLDSATTTNSRRKNS
jgi:hypothetical protein